MRSPQAQTLLFVLVGDGPLLTWLQSSSEKTRVLGYEKGEHAARSFVVTLRRFEPEMIR